MLLTFEISEIDPQTTTEKSGVEIYVFQDSR